tara:strand:- start:1925 stop:2329 length:405 start_codon:yes stop_codon:yes gene_type:complete
MKNHPSTIRKARQVLSKGDTDERKAVLQELEAIGASEITDVLTWTGTGQVIMKSSEDLSHGARKAIKKVKITPTKLGSQIEVEMHDKMAALRMLAKHRGLLDSTSDINRPSVIGINLQGPKDVTYEIKDEKTQE